MEQIVQVVILAAIVLTQLVLSHRARLREIACEHLKLSIEQDRIAAENAMHERNALVQVQLAQMQFSPQQEAQDEPTHPAAPVSPWRSRLAGVFQSDGETVNGNTSVGG